MKKLPVGKALAELAVIVLGILIALFAESAWDDYQDRIEGRHYLARLSVEIKTNLQLLDWDISWTDLSCSSVEAVLDNIQGNNPLDPAAVLRFAAFAATYANPEYQRVTYDDLTTTGKLSLIGDATLREDIVSAYTVFFEGMNAWRPAKQSALRTSVLRILPREYVERVVRECLTTPAEDPWKYAWTDCSTMPATGSADYWSDRLLGEQDLEGDLAERAWQVCGFAGDMDPRREHFETLAPRLDQLAK